MEARKITIVSTKNQSNKVIMSGAETLGQLKADLRSNNIDYSNMAFYEGTAKVELKADDSRLPVDVPYKGNITNELVIMLTNTNKKIKSGSVATRQEAADFIKANNLGDAVKSKFNKNWTNCKTDELIKFVNSYAEKSSAKSAPKAKVESKETTKAETPKESISEANVAYALALLVDILKGKTISNEKANLIYKALGKNVTSAKSGKDSSYSNSEIDSMFKGMC